MEKDATASPQLSKMNTLNISLNIEVVVLSIAYVGDTELRVQTELAPCARTFQNLQVPCRPTRVLKLTIDRNEENFVRIARALEGNSLNHVTFTKVSMKLIPDIAKCLLGMRSKSVTIYLEKLENEQQCHEFADVIFALKSVDDFAVDVTIQDHSEHTSLFLSILAEKAHKLIVDIHHWDESETKCLEKLTPLLFELASQSTPNKQVFIKNQFAPFKTASINFRDLCSRLEASQSRRRLLFHVDAKPTDIVETSSFVAFKCVPFQESFVAHIDSTGEECDCYACAYNERIEAEARERAE